MSRNKNLGVPQNTNPPSEGHQGPQSPVPQSGLHGEPAQALRSQPSSSTTERSFHRLHLWQPVGPRRLSQVHSPQLHKAGRLPTCFCGGHHSPQLCLLTGTTDEYVPSLNTKTSLLFTGCHRQAIPAAALSGTQCQLYPELRAACSQRPSPSHC